MQPFDKHKSDVGELEGCGSTLVSEGATSLENGSMTRTAYQPAVSSVKGMCAPEIQRADKPVQDSAQSANESLVWAAVVTRYWGSRVQQFNARVDTITSNLADKGPHYGAQGEDGEPPSHGDVTDAKAGATSEARRQWWHAHGTYIEDGGTRAASMLKEGPTAGNMRIARDAGALPPMQIQAWDTFVKGMQGQAVPPTEQGVPGVGLWAVGSANTVGGWMSTWQTFNRSRFAPRGASGRFMSLSNFRNTSWWNRTTGYTSARNYVPRAGQAANVTKWAKVGKYTKVGGAVVSGAVGAWDQWSRDSGRSALDTSDKVVRATTRGGLNAAGAAAGAWAGAQGGAMLGAAVGGPVGAAVGGVVGGIVGGVIGSGIGNKVADFVMGDVTDFANEAGDWAGDRLDDAGEALDEAGDWAEDKLDDLKFW